MVLALYGLAGVMMAGGLVAILSGSDIIVMERGWTMVIAGSVFTGCGALLAGVATAVARLQAIESSFTRLADRLGRGPELLEQGARGQEPRGQETRGQETRGQEPRAQEPRVQEPPRAQEPLLAPPVELAGPKASSGAELAAAADHRDLDIVPEPILSVPTAGRAAPPAAGREDAGERSPPAADLDEAIFAREPAPAPAAEEPAAKSAPPTIVGTYNSGGNFYVMYSDGSIEAETPAGKFRFDSLEELKEFIAAGGDKAKATQA